MKYVLTLVGVLLLMLAWGAPNHVAFAKEAQYVGAHSCGRCHKRSKTGDQLGVWKKSEHAEAFKVLGTADGKKAAQAAGVSGDPQKAEACLVCHTTGYGEPDSRFHRRFKMEDGVQCEACHGPGSNYDKMGTMKKIFKESKKGSSATAKKVGLVIPDAKTCETCHTQQRTYKGKTYKNPNYKPFNFKEMFKKIAHPVP